MVRYPATRKETRGRKKRPTNHPSVERQTEVRRKRSTLFLPHKSIMCQAYAAKVLVARLRLRWIIHPGGFVSPLKYTEFMNRAYHMVGVGVNLHTCVFNHAATLHRAGHWGALKRREGMQPAMWKPSGALSRTAKNRLSTRFGKRNCLCFCGSTATNCSMKPSRKSWQACIGKQSAGSHQWLQRCWPWHSSLRHTPAFRMTK